MTNFFMQISIDLENYFMEFVDGSSYCNLISTCKDLYTNAQKYSKTRPQTITLDVCKALHQIFDRKQNVLLIGPGGCGKSYCIDRINRWAIRKGIHVQVTGTTGISAMNVNGRTIHSFTGVHSGSRPLSYYQNHHAQNENKFKKYYGRWKKVDLLIIDEISMLGAKMFETLDFISKVIRDDPRPFGGLQVVFAGDFLQLPPVGDRFAFTSPQWRTLNLKAICFQTPFRQKADIFYYELLQRVRFGICNENDIRKLKSRDKAAVPKCLFANVGKDFVPPVLYGMNKQVLSENQLKFHSFEGAITTKTCTDQFYRRVMTQVPNENGGTVQKIDFVLIPPVPVPETIRDAISMKLPALLNFKHNAQYILTINCYAQDKCLVNGAQCIYDEEKQQMRFKSGKSYPLQNFYRSMKFPVNLNEQIYLSRHQYAFCLGYAVTIHKSQGLTLESAVIDLGNSIFASAQTYVALSRVQSLKTVYLLNFEESSLKVHRGAREYVASVENVILPPMNNPVKKKASKKRARENEDVLEIVL